MEVPTFEWDPQKATANLKAHGVSFDEAVTVIHPSRTHSREPTAARSARSVVNTKNTSPLMP